MGFVLGFLSALIAAALAGWIPLRRRLARAALARDFAALARDRALAREAATMRLLRLSADDLRGAALTLLGHAARLHDSAPARAAIPPRTAHVAAILALTGHMLSLSDDLHDEATDIGAHRVLHDEVIALDGLLQDVILAVVTLLGPSVRNWKIEPDVAGVSLRADRRALRQVLTRVLTNAARFTREQDWIDIGIERGEGSFSLVIVDEGAGLLTVPALLPPSAGGTAVARQIAMDSRGMGLGLALARSLMQAHGGTLGLESRAQVGTRVTLSLPAERLLPPALAA